MRASKRTALLGWMLGAAAAYAQSPPVTMHIETASGQTQFRVGEAIPLKLTFDNTAGEPWFVELVNGDRAPWGLLADRFVVSPSAGVDDPLLYRMHEGFGGTGAGPGPLPGGTTVYSVDLNQWARFTRPGTYRVSASFDLRWPLQNRKLPVTSNSIEIQVVAADKAWAEQELRRDGNLLHAPVGTAPSEYGRRIEAARRLWYLDTVESLHETARLLTNERNNLTVMFVEALSGSGQPERAFATMKEAMADPDLPISLVFLETLAGMEARQQVPLPPDPGAQDVATVAAARRRYELQASLDQTLDRELQSLLEKKRGGALAVSLETVIHNLPAADVTAELRGQMAQLFTDLPPAEQLAMLGGDWLKLKGPEIAPVLRKVYDANLPQTGLPQRRYMPDQLAPMAVERLYRLDPGQARGLILAEIRKTPPGLPYETLAMLPDKTLPEMDEVLIDHLEQGVAADKPLIARYATRAILDRVAAVDAQEKAVGRYRPEVRGARPACNPELIGYYLRVDPSGGEQALRNALADRTWPQCRTGVFDKTAAYDSSGAWEKVAIEALQDPAVPIKTDAVKTLGARGSVNSAPAVWASFRYWHDWWKDRPAEINAENRNFEIAFMDATIRAKSWTASGPDLAEISSLCISDGCRRQVENLRRQWEVPLAIGIWQSPAGNLLIAFAQYDQMSPDDVKRRLTQLPTGTRLTWNEHIAHSPDVDALIAEITKDLPDGVTLVP